MADVNPTLLIIALNVNGTNKKSFSELIKHQASAAAFKRHSTFKDTNRLRAKGWGEILYTNSNHKKQGLAMLI